jgi:hypothetical protein
MVVVILWALKWVGCLQPGTLHEFQVKFLPHQAGLY